MAKKVQLEVEVKGNDSVGKAAEKTKSLRQELIKLKDELGRGELSGGEFVKAQQRAAELQKTIDDVNKSTKGLSSNNLDAFLDLGQGIAGGFAAAQGAMALFGNENEDLQKKLVKVQSAVAILNGLQGVQKVLAKEGIIVTKITNFLEAQRAAAISTTSVALQGAAVKARMFGLALAATGIGIAIVAIGILAEKFGLFGDSVDETTKKLEESRERLNKYAEQVAELDALSINRKKRETDLAKARLKLNGATNDELIEQDKRLLEYQKVLLEMQVKDRAEGSDEQLKAIDKLEDVKNQIALKEIEREIDIKNRKKKLDEEAEKKFDDNRKSALKRAKDELKDLVKKFDDEQKAFKDDIKAKQDIADELEEALFQKELEANIKYGELIEQRRIDDLSIRDKELFDIEEKYRKEQELALGNASLLAEIQTDKDNALREKRKQFDAEDASLQEEADNVRLEQIANTAAQAGQLINQIAGKNKAAALTALALEKGAAIANVVVNTQREIAAYRANPTWSLLPDGGAAIKATNIIAAKVRAGISIASISAAGLSGAKNITSGGSGGSVQPPNIRGSQTTNEQPTPQPTKVFVTETDIRSVTRKVDGIFSQATII